MSLQTLVDGTMGHNASLWQTLRALLSNKDGNAVAGLSHVKTGDERIETQPESKLECVRRVSGNHFGMKTLYDHSSYF